MPANVESMFSAGVLPWHKLGNVPPGALKKGEAIIQAGHDFKVEGHKTFTKIDGRYVEVPGYKTTVRSTDGKPLGVVGEAYEILQTEELYDFTEALLSSGDVEYETAGVLYGGKVVWVCTRLKEEIKINGDGIAQYMMVANAFDGSMSWTAVASNVRVVCSNTFNLALSGAKARYTVRHSTNARDRIRQAREALGMTFVYGEAFEKEVAELMEQTVNAKQTSTILGKVFPTTSAESERTNQGATERRKKVRQRLAEDPTIVPFAGTGWGLLNAVNSYELWDRPVRGGDSPELQRATRQAIGTLSGEKGTLTAVTHGILVRAR